ncbi:MAG: ornithine cyclodeaminase family protein [bacterium]|jgi:ornithine cyclodeaminase/alanine dehydrogenase-like protein (mu-crystallin family)
MPKPEILFLQQEDVIKAGALNMQQVLAEVEEVFRLHGAGKLINPNKTLLEISAAGNNAAQSVFISMPVYIGGQVNKAGVKWAAESKRNLAAGDLPMGIDLLILSDPLTVTPVAIMDGTLITAMRTSAATGVAVKYLARPDASAVGLIGAGVIGQTAVMMLKEVLPSLQTIKIYDRNKEKAAALAAAASVPAAGAVSTAAEAVRDSDVVITMTTARTPFLPLEWLKPGCLCAQIGTREVADDVIMGADRVVVDDWEPTKHYPGTAFHDLYEKGLIADTDVTNLRDIVAGKSPGRKNEQEIILFDSFGMGCEDIIVAARLYENAKAAGIGKKLALWDEPKWV